MGNTASGPNSPDLSSAIDVIAAKYIMTQNFSDMSRLSDPKYCRELVVMSSNLLAHTIQQDDIAYLRQQRSGDKVVDHMNRDTIGFAYKRDLMGLIDDGEINTNKRRICIGLAETYVKIAHIFAAISTVLDPRYTYKSVSGQQVTSTREERSDLSPDQSTKVQRNYTNLCTNRFNELVKNVTVSTSSRMFGKPSMKLGVGMCGADFTRDHHSVLTSEHGIPEMEALYRDIYDHNVGGYVTMSDKAKTEYRADVERFYRTFTGRSEPLPKDITKFSQIKLIDYNKSQICESGVLGAISGIDRHTGSKLFDVYGRHTRDMMKRIDGHHEKLLDIIKLMFEIRKDGSVSVRSTITNDILGEIASKTRREIADMYIQCESDYQEGFKIFETIVEQKYFDILSSTNPNA